MEEQPQQGKPESATNTQTEDQIQRPKIVDIAKLYHELVKVKPPKQTDFESDEQFDARYTTWRRNNIPSHLNSPVSISSGTVLSPLNTGRLTYYKYDLTTRTIAFKFKGLSGCDFAIRAAPGKEGAAIKSGYTTNAMGIRTEAVQVTAIQYCVSLANKSRPNHGFLYQIELDPQEAEYLSKSMHFMLTGTISEPFTAESSLISPMNKSTQAQVKEISRSVMMKVTDIAFINPKTHKVVASFQFSD